MLFLVSRSPVLRGAVGCVACGGRALSSVKVSTGLVGLEADAEAPQRLRQLYEEALHKLATGVPQDSQYRQNLEKHIAVRMEVLDRTSDIREIEEAINYGQIEELVEQALDELEVIDVVIQDKAWEAP